MQTNFTEVQLRDPAIQVADSILRSCVHCGFCTATCPSFITVGDEDDSPRGRIYLIKEMLESGSAASAPVAFHLDRCLSCLSCMTTCPSGVDYMHLIDHARTHVEQTFRRPWHDRGLRAVLAAILPYPARMRWALRAAGLARPFVGLIPQRGVLFARMRAMLTLAASERVVAQGVGDVTAQTVHPAQGTRRGRVLLLAGCAQRVLDPGIHAATIRLLNRMGVEVVIPQAAGCCGALTHHMGKHAAFVAQAGATIRAMTDALDEETDAIIINVSGCGTVVKDYGFALRGEDPDLAGKAAKISALAMDVSAYLLKIGYQRTRPESGLTIAYHAACSLQHGQKITDAPKALLRQAGFRVVEPRDAHLCCGSAGTYNILQPEIASSLRARKLDTLTALSPDAIAAGNIGCLTQLAGAGIPTIHTVELLDWMAGGPCPAGLKS